MAGHSKWANIQHRKGKQDARRSKMFSKLAKEITVATKMGMADPAFNPRLRLAVQNAKAVSMPKDVIDRAIKKGSASDGENYEEIRYEGRGPDGVGIIVEALTDNRNRTASEVRAAFTKNGGALGETGSASFGFDRLGVIEYKGEIGSEDDVLEAALDAGAADVESDADSHTIYCDLTELNEVAAKLEARFGEPEAARIGWRPQTWIELTGEKLDTMIKLYDAIDDLDDVQNVYANFDVAEADMARLRG